MKCIPSLVFLATFMLPQLHARLLSSSQPIEDSSTKFNFHNLSPKQLGALHNDIIMKVHERIKDNIPENNFEYSAIVVDEVSALCNDSDGRCRKRIHEDAVRSQYELKEMFRAGDLFSPRHVFPDQMEDDAKKYLNDIYETTLLLKDQSLEEVLYAIDDISEQIESSDMKSIQKQGLLSVASIATGSSVLWSYMLTDTDNAFYKIHSRRFSTIQNRTVTGSEMLRFVAEYVIADVVGAIRGLIIPIEMILTQGDEATLIYSIARESITWSLEVVGIILPYPMDYFRCIVGEFIDFSIYENPLSAMFYPQDCTIEWLFGPTIANILSNFIQPTDEGPT